MRPSTSYGDAGGGIKARWGLVKTCTSLFGFRNPLIDLRRCDGASFGFMWSQRSRCELHSFGRQLLRKLLGLNLSRKSLGLSPSSQGGARTPIARPLNRDVPVIGEVFIYGHDGPPWSADGFKRADPDGRTSGSSLIILPGLGDRFKDAGRCLGGLVRGNPNDGHLMMAVLYSGNVPQAK
jgi:hypothetical protein